MNITSVEHHAADRVLREPSPGNLLGLDAVTGDVTRSMEIIGAVLRGQFTISGDETSVGLPRIEWAAP